ncbi:MAG: hypothetical protein BGO05_10130 [Rhizobiales bacterium 63-7]|nr:MAG: hypothetical protein BGO05_10130 [Rhizobiales bacterium 63-7]
MTEAPNKADFSVNERAGEYRVPFVVTGSIETTINADSLEEARAKASAMTEDEEFGLELDQADYVSVDYVSACRPMYRVTREGKAMQVSHLLPGDEPRQPDERGF